MIHHNSLKTTFVTFFSVFIFILPVCAQQKIQGKVIQENNKAVPFATLRLASESKYIITDSAGNFTLYLPSHKQNDTLLISSVGFEPLRVPLVSAAGNGKYILKTFSQKMETVVVRSFSKEDVAGAKSDNVGYFRSWNADHTGGEIGRVFYMPYSAYQLTRLRFKLFSTCDTCLIKLHIREMKGGIPGDDILEKQVIQNFPHAESAEKTCDIDLLKYKLILDNENIFIGFEVLKGSSGAKRCSVSFVGSESGNYMYKSDEEGSWRSSDDFAIHMKLVFRYDD